MEPPILTILHPTRLDLWKPWPPSPWRSARSPASASTATPRAPHWGPGRATNCAWSEAAEAYGKSENVGNFTAKSFFFKCCKALSNLKFTGFLTWNFMKLHETSWNMLFSNIQNSVSPHFHPVHRQRSALPLRRAAAPRTPRSAPVMPPAENRTVQTKNPWDPWCPYQCIYIYIWHTITCYSNI